MADLHVLPASNDNSAERIAKAKRLLADAQDKELRGVVILGVDEDSDLYMSLTGITNEEAVFLCEIMKERIVKTLLGQ